MPEQTGQCPIRPWIVLTPLPLHLLHSSTLPGPEQLGQDFIRPWTSTHSSPLHTLHFLEPPWLETMTLRDDMLEGGFFSLSCFPA